MKIMIFSMAFFILVLFAPAMATINPLSSVGVELQKPQPPPAPKKAKKPPKPKEPKKPKPHKPAKKPKPPPRPPW